MTKLRADTLIRLLRDNPRARTAMLCERLGGLDKSTVTRGLKALGGQVVSRGCSHQSRISAGL
ncbi:hypothetical protein [Thermithiobacillus plumbiphilus]|uniref:Uncharacterized protein n=1 Tax=Thermithiobacillus plumbiphilus TaxID=1729899 RepID=A0ABU9D754_9PROT